MEYDRKVDNVALRRYNACLFVVALPVLVKDPWREAVVSGQLSFKLSMISKYCPAMKSVN